MPPDTTPSAYDPGSRSRLPLRVAAGYLAFGLAWVWGSDVLLASAGEMSRPGFWAAVAKGTAFVGLSAGLVYGLVLREFRTLRRTTNLLRAVVDGTTDAVFVKDRDGKYLLCNEATARLAGKPAADILGRDDTALFDPDSAAFLMARDRGVMAGGQPESAEEELTAAGVPRTYLTTKAPYRGESGAVIGLIGVSRDITDRVRDDEDLRASEARFRELFDGNPVPTWVYDAETLRFLDVNPAAVAGYGYSQDEFLGMTLRDIRPPDDVPALLAAVAAGRTGDIGVWRHRAKDGREILARVRWGRVRVGGKAAVQVSATDVTEQARAEGAVRASERRFRELADAIPQIVWTARADGALTHLNAKVTEYAGIPADELTGWDWSRIIHPDDLSATVAAWQDILRTGVPRSTEFRIRRADGEYRWHVARQTPAHGTGGGLIGWYGTCTDIEDLKRAEDELRAERTLLRTLIDAIPDPVFTKDTAGRFQVCNRASAALSGAGAEAELTGKTVFDLFPPDQAAGFHADDLRVLAGEAIFAREEQVRDPSGRDVWRLVTKVPLRDPSGAVVGLVGVSRDIQRRKEQEQALAASEARLVEAQRIARLGSWGWDPDTGRVWWSDAVYDLFGLPRDTAPSGAAFLALVHPADRPAAEARVRRVLDGADGFADDLRVVRPDGREMWVHSQARVTRGADGRVLRVDGTDQDITARKRAEEAVRESERKLAAVAATVPQGLYVFDVAERRTVYSNRELWAELGYTPDDAARVGPGFVNTLIHPDDRAKLPALLARWATAADGQVLEVEYRVRAASGEWRWFLGRDAVYQRDAGGRVRQIIGTTQDITDRRAAEDALRESEERFRIMANAAPVLIWVADADKACTWFNRPWLEFTGRPMEEEAGHGWADGVHPDDTARCLKVYVEAFDARRPFVMDYRLRRHDGEYRWLQDSGAPRFDPAGAFAGYIGSCVDVTDRRAAEEALRASEERLRLALEAGRMGIFDWDLRTDRVVWSETHYDLWDYPPGDRPAVEYRTFRDRVHPDDVPGVEAALAHARQDRTPYRQEYRVLLRGGGVRWIAGRGEFRFGPDGEPTRMVGTVQDVTDRRAAEAALRESEGRFRTMAEVLPAAVFVHAGGKVAYANPALARLLGAGDPAELLGASPLDIAHPDYHPLVRERQALMAATDAPAPGIEMRAVRRDGRAVPVYSVATPVTGYGPDAFLVALSDLTDRERANELLRSVLGSVGDAILTIDGRGTVRTANRATERLFGYAEAELVGGNVCVLMPEPHRSAHDDYVGNYLRTGHAKVIGIGRELEARRKDGSTFPIELTVTEFRLDGERQFTGVVRDITARRRLEDQFRQAQKMEAVGQLAGGVAHDFNNLLTVINGYTDMVLEDLPADDPHRPMLVPVREAGDRARGLTAQLLAFSRKAIVEPRVLDVNEVLEHLGKMLRRLIGEDVTYAARLAPELGRVTADPGQLEQVVMNLVVNARDAMPTGGRLTVETGNFVLPPGAPPPAPDVPPGRYVRLTVSDTGTGIPPDVVGKIFDPFFTTKEAGKGTGLGLATVYGIVKQGGGHIGVETAAGVGTTFTLLIPATDSGETAAPPLSGAQVAPRGAETVLLVEDEDAVRAVGRLALESQGYTVLEAGDGSEALLALAAHPGPVHLLVTDVVLPGRCGRELADAVRAARPGVRVLFVSGYTDDAVVRHGVAGATDAFLQKPFTPLTLARKVRHVLDRG